MFSKRKYAIFMKLSISLKQTDVCILSDSQAALRAHDPPHITSRSLFTCRISLEKIATQMNTCLCWVPGHRDIPANCKAGELARAGINAELQSLHNDYGIPIVTLKREFEEESIREAN